ncbi:FAD-dependent oxidoreductase [Crenobacter sp. SG2303]|uniref:FAD-dependent oxidoreductase n=1 Tax=Crenobacter oryzisoli TaxID=3056844 RepID=A0ABT7XRI8_9NEIS|nr:3-phenylpropionate/cinnamic acid dioxygenase ferredoxin--NAD(+) reductase subunit [Crenobacter sp. SG2303]MDN0076406.1 FAD-dependent oxidoreductase [Crenobacter sp. SG2303]
MTRPYSADASEVFVIIGAGQTGATAAAEMRQQGFSGRIILIGEEPHLPYERPPLSKDVLLQPANTRCQIYPDTFYSDNAIELRLGHRVTDLNLTLRQVVLANGEVTPFDKLLLATGSRVRRYPLLDRLERDVYTLRTLDDAEALKPVLQPGKRILIVGGGVIGLELASSAVDLGAQVQVIEQAPRLMGRGAPLVVADYLQESHRQRGVHFHLGAGLISAERGDGEIVLTLDNGMCLSGDAVIYGIGVELNTELASAAGLAVDKGVLINEHCRTSHPSIYAAGDVASQWNPALEQYVRLETWENAKNQAIAAAQSMVSGVARSFEVPWFWSDQCGMNIQLAGSSVAQEWLVRGQLSDSRFTLIGMTDGRVVGAVTVNNGRDMRSVKTLIASQASPDRALLLDSTKDLRRLVC